MLDTCTPASALTVSRLAAAAVVVPAALICPGIQVTASGDIEGGRVAGGVSRRSDHTGAVALLRIHSLAGEKVAQEQDGGRARVTGAASRSPLKRLPAEEALQVVTWRGRVCRLCWQKAFQSHNLHR